MDPLLEYHAAFLVCAACGRADPLPLSVLVDKGFQMRLPEGWNLRRYALGDTAVWAICPKCLAAEPTEAPTCIACGLPLSGHAPTCRTLEPEDGNALIEQAMAGIIDGRKNLDWEIWDFVDRVLVAHYATEEEVKAEIVRLYEAMDPATRRVRYIVLEPHNLIRLDERRSD